jgi:hypothetical protein
MPHQEERRGLEKALRSSLRILPIYVTIAMVGITLLWGAHEYLGLPAWIAYVFGIVSAYAVVGDAINILYVRRKLRLLGRRQG